MPPKQYDIDDELMRDFLCSNTNMTFNSNPFDLRTVYQLNCSYFTTDEELFVHLHFDQDPVFVEGESDTFMINRTDMSYQYFNLSYTPALEFLIV